MTYQKKQNALNILNYWKLTEFLNQVDIVPENILRKRISTDKEKIELFHKIEAFNLDLKQILANDKMEFPKYKKEGGVLYFCFGNTKRNIIVDYLSKYVENTNPEEYPPQSSIAWFSLQTNNDGMYIENSFQLSPIMWVISQWKNNSSIDFRLDIEQYNILLKNIENKLLNMNIEDVLIEIYQYIYENFIIVEFKNISETNIGYFEYNRYINEKEEINDKLPTDYSDLGKSFFTEDISLLISYIQNDNFANASKNGYEEKVIDYILAACNQGDNKNIQNITSNRQESEQMKLFFEEKLDILKAPKGKWPSKYMPALMQQVAINIGIQENEPPIFSVNGPPGTGKTTLLKEIIANNIVERAYLLAKWAIKPDDIFEICNYTSPGAKEPDRYYKNKSYFYKIKQSYDKINNYGMLVASCNNSAVENITIDLPQGMDLLKGLMPSNKDNIEVKRGLEEIIDLFDVEKSEDKEVIYRNEEYVEQKDVYFTRYANSLLGKNDCWGLISAPLGKRKNIENYCNCVLSSLVDEYKDANLRKTHLEKYTRIRDIFIKQYEKVCSVESKIKEFSEIEREIPSEYKNYNTEYLFIKLEEYKKEINKLKSLTCEKKEKLKKLNNKYIIFSKKKINKEISIIKKELNFLNQKKATDSYKNQKYK